MFAHKTAKRSVRSELGEWSFTCDNFGRLWMVPSVANDSTCSFNLGWGANSFSISGECCWEAPGNDGVKKLRRSWDIKQKTSLLKFLQVLGWRAGVGGQEGTKGTACGAKPQGGSLGPKTPTQRGRDPPSAHQNHLGSLWEFQVRSPHAWLPWVWSVARNLNFEKALQICLCLPSQLPPLRCYPSTERSAGGFQNLSRRKEAGEKAGAQHQLGDLESSCPRCPPG